MFDANKKIKTIAQLKRILARDKRSGRRVVFTNGCFDILHYGHVKYLSKARKLGDILVVAVNSDSSVRKIKGRGRPINAQLDRARLVGALGFVDYVTIFPETTPLNAIRQIKPDFLVKGGDWKKQAIVGSDFVEAYGGAVVSLPYLAGYSTTSMLSSIKKCRRNG